MNGLSNLIADFIRYYPNESIITTACMSQGISFYRTSNAPEFIQEMDIKDVLETPMALAMGHFTSME